MITISKDQWALVLKLIEWTRFLPSEYETMFRPLAIAITSQSQESDKTEESAD